MSNQSNTGSSLKKLTKRLIGTNSLSSNFCSRFCCQVSGPVLVLLLGAGSSLYLRFRLGVVVVGVGVGVVVVGVGVVEVIGLGVGFEESGWALLRVLYLV